MATAATSGLPADVLAKTIVFTPNVQKAPLAGTVWCDRLGVRQQHQRDRYHQGSDLALSAA